MKKLLALVIVSMFSLNSLAARTYQLLIDNQTDAPVRVSDQDDNQLIVDPGRSEMRVKIHKQYDGYGTVPNADMPRATRMIITEVQTNQSNSIDIDDDTKTLIIKPWLRLTLEKR